MRRFRHALAAILVIVVAPAGLLGAAATATAGAASFTYDAPTVARVDVREFEAAGASPAKLRSSQYGSGSPSAAARGTSTTPSARVLATNSGAKGLNLPSQDSKLATQIDDVVAHVDEFGTPPSGVAQGGLKGQPVGTYGNKSGALPSQPLGYYTEMDVWASQGVGSGTRGAERLVTGANGEVYYSPDHYTNWVRIR